MNYKSICDLSKDIVNNIHRIPHDVDLVVGVPRSGLLVANMIALFLNIQITDVDGLLSDHIISCGNTKKPNGKGNILHVSDCKKILVVEDTVYSGTSIKSVKDRIENSHLSCEILFFAAYVSPGKESLVDLYLQVIPSPRVFEWNLFHSSVLEYSCVDIDGVLCADPSEDENDDGEQYRRFLESAAPKIIPSQQIKYIVSSRLEKYRAETEKWLAQHHILYEKLFLLDVTAEERRKKGLHAVFKSKIYQQSGCALFIESSASQAAYISGNTGKPVYCTENNSYYDRSSNAVTPSGNSLPGTRKTLRSYLAKIPFLKKIYIRIKALKKQNRMLL